jgi:hypothetical protein
MKQRHHLKRIFRYFMAAAGLWGLSCGVGLTATNIWTGSIPGNVGGHLKIFGNLSRLPDDAWMAADDDRTLVDGAGELRLTWRNDFSKHLSFTAHYENRVSGGDTRSRQQDLLDRFPMLAQIVLFQPAAPEDDRRLFDLTGHLEENDDYIWYHRLDRFFLGWHEGAMDIRAGRQAVTWGNGQVFNPMDLFNPFAPTDVVRDYKTGDDLLSAEITRSWGNLHLLYVPRRDPADHSVSWDHSSLAAKYHFTTMTGLEIDVMAGRHYRDLVAGTGLAGYLGAAAWRLDTVLTIPDDDDTLWTDRKEQRPYLSVVANTDLSWFWFAKNWYGFLEIYYNGLMNDDYARDVAVPYISERLARGDLYSLGKLYAAAMVQFEAHPLVNIYLTAVTNLNDPSGVLLPRIIYDITQNGQITLGGSLNWGGEGTEYGGWEIPYTGFDTTPADTVYLRATRFF